MQEITENQDASIDRIVKLISEELGKKEEHVANVIRLMDEAIPYRLSQDIVRKPMEPWMIPVSESLKRG